MSNQYGPRIVTNGLVLCLDAGNTKSYPGSGTVWTDLSGNNNNGTLTNGPTYNSSNGGNISFDGTNDYMNLGKPTTLNFGSGSFSIGLWIKPTTGNILKVIGSKGNNGNSGWWIAFDNRYNSNTEAIGFSTSSWSSNLAYVAKETTSAYKYNINKWNHIICMWNATIKDIYIYLNNTLTTTTVVQSGGGGAANVTNTDNSNYNTVFMAYDSGGSLWSPGSISNITMYNRTLSASEISQNYNATKGRFGL